MQLYNQILAMLCQPKKKTINATCHVSEIFIGAYGPIPQTDKKTPKCIQSYLSYTSDPVKRC